MGYALQRHVAGALDRPFVVLFEQDSTDEAGDGILVGGDADGFGVGEQLGLELYRMAQRLGQRRPRGTCASTPSAHAK